MRRSERASVFSRARLSALPSAYISVLLPQALTYDTARALNAPRDVVECPEQREN